MAGELTTWFILARAVHFGACLLFFGMFAFDRVVLPVLGKSGRSDTCINWSAGLGLFSLILLPVILLSGIAWFLLVAMTMSDGPPQWEVLKTVWTQTQFGGVWKLRLYVWTLAVVVTAFPQFAVRFKNLAWLPFLVSGALVASLAWAGHGQEDSPWHVGADMLHLLVAGFWPAGLFPLALVMRIIRKTSGAHANELTAVVRRFSAVSLASVAMLTITGFVNAWYLVGPVQNLFYENYGRWLMVKIVLFAVTIGFGAMNLIRIKPRLELPLPDAAVALAQLRWNIRAEICLTTLIIIAVAILGVLPPPGH